MSLFIHLYNTIIETTQYIRNEIDELIDYYELHEVIIQY